MKKKPGGGAAKPLFMGAVAAAVAVGSYLLFSGSGKQTAEPPKSERAGDVLAAANRDAELRKAKAKEELAAAQTRQAVALSSPGSSALPPSTASPDLSRPPANGLVLWFDAAKGTRADADGGASVLNGPAGQWLDNAANGGSAVFQYTSSTTPGKENNYPTLITSSAKSGLKVPQPVLSFDGQGDTLCVRDRDKTGDPIAASLDGGNVSVILIYRAAGGDAEDGLLSARNDRKQALWSLGVKDRGFVAGPGDGAPLNIAGTEAEFRIASFVLDAAGSLHLGLISSDGQKVSGDRKVKADTAAHVEMLRMGTSDGANGKSRSMFAGEISEVLIYNRALDRDTRHHAEDFLRLKHFGSTGPTVTARR